MQFCNGITIEKTSNGLTLLTPYYLSRNKSTQTTEKVLLEAFYLPTNKIENLLENRNSIKSQFNESNPVDI
jgi:hypothetical protein